jgi:hypothetical protein
MNDERDQSNEPEGAADVRAAIEQLSGGSPPPELDHDQLAARNIGDQISTQLGEEEARRRDGEPAETRQGRDQRGRFAPKAEVPEAVTENRIEAPEAAGDVSRAPVGWRMAAKQQWNTLPGWAREEVHKREADVSKGLRESWEREHQYREIEGLIAPRLQHLEQQFGIRSGAQVISHLLTFSDALVKNPVGAIAGLVQHYRMSPEQIFGPGAGRGGPSQQQIDAHIAEQVALRSAQQTIREFEADPPPHYETVKPIMKSLLEAGQATSMKQAYNLAIKSLPARPDQKLASKIRASNASLSGAPHGVNPSKRTNGHAKGTFGEVTEDVRAAISQLTG